jgi:hypothetical protein
MPPEPSLESSFQGPRDFGSDFFKDSTELGLTLGNFFKLLRDYQKQFSEDL